MDDPLSSAAAIDWPTVLAMVLRRREQVDPAELAAAFGTGREVFEAARATLTAEGYLLTDADGWRLQAVPDRLFPREIRAGLACSLLGRTIVHHDVVGSTNDIARQLARQGAPEGTVVVAEAQTAGRGRLGRGWQAAPGTGLLLSVVLRPTLAAQRLAWLPVLAGVAAARAIGRASGLHCGLKWPNDLLLDGRKVAGILVEMHSEADRAHLVVVGIGINVNQTAAELTGKLARSATSLALAAGRPVGRVALAQALLEELEEGYRLLLAGGWPIIRERWTAGSATLGRRVRAVVGDRVLSGVATGLDESGALVVETSQGVQRVWAGEVALVRHRSS